MLHWAHGVMHYSCFFEVFTSSFLPPTVDNFSEASANDEQDLNKVSEQMLAQEKKKMDGLFETNQVLPGERDWKYDKQRDFEPPQMESGWDSESSSTQKF